MPEPDYLKDHQDQRLAVNTVQEFTGDSLKAAVEALQKQQAEEQKIRWDKAFEEGREAGLREAESRIDEVYRKGFRNGQDDARKEIRCALCNAFGIPWP